MKKSPASDSSVYMNAIGKLKEFIDSTYGGVETFINISDDELCGKQSFQPSAKHPVEKRTVYSSTVEVPQPCCGEIEKYLVRWNELDNYYQQESALDKLFFRTYPNNTDIDDVLIKVSSLNDLYSTNIFSPFQVAKYIIDLKIDERLQTGDVTLVNDIAKVKMVNGTVINFYSLATKYCSHHKPLDFPIYDSYVDRLLRYFRDSDGFFRFVNNDLKAYTEFKNILVQFRSFYNLEQYNLKDIDKYLWQLGKEEFSKRY